MFLKQLDQFMLQYHPFKVENIAKQQKWCDDCASEDPYMIVIIFMLTGSQISSRVLPVCCAARVTLLAGHGDGLVHSEDGHLGQRCN
jgi:hypothetical protein